MKDCAEPQKNISFDHIKSYFWGKFKNNGKSYSLYDNKEKEMDLIFRNSWDLVLYTHLYASCNYKKKHIKDKKCGGNVYLCVLDELWILLERREIMCFKKMFEYDIKTIVLIFCISMK